MNAANPQSATPFRLFPTLLISALAVMLVSCGQKPSETEKPTPPPPTNATNSASTAQPNPVFKKLLGQWLRPDGGYILEIKSIDENGQMQASYFNPQPIHVSKAEVKTEAGATRLFVELQDTGYPGCTYKLLFDPASDTLVGTYFQAAMREEFSIAFERHKP